MSDFHLECLQNEYLSRGVRTMSAVIVVTALGSEAVGQTVLRVWTPEDASVTTLKQMEPPLDLTGTRVVVNNLTGDYAMGSWHEESRDFPSPLGSPRWCSRRSWQLGSRCWSTASQVRSVSSLPPRPRRKTLRG
jgi:hypothetical protein